MAVRSALLAICAAATLALGGCNESHSTGNVPIEELGAVYASTVCDALLDCYGEALLASFVGTDCEGSLGRRFDEGTLPQFEAAIADGTVIYDGARAGVCFDDLAALGCGVLTARLSSSACTDAVMGTVASGGACSITAQCAGDAFCSIDAACPGTCQARGASGTACTDDDACQSGLTCQAGTCRAPAGAGAACGGASAIGCAGGLLCLGADGMMTGTCQSVTDALSAELGATCDPRTSELCQPGLSCAATTFMPPTLAFTCVGRADPSGPCTFAVPDQCPTDQACDASPLTGGSVTGTCRPLPGDGMACVNSRCAADTRCQDGVCRAIHGLGGTCTTGADCYSGTCVSGTCAEGMLCGG